jgi:hypothetical protein
MVIKEVKMVEKKRQRRKPPRFQQSPDKHIVKNAIRAARRRQCIDQALKKTKIEVKTEPLVQTKPEVAQPKTNGHVDVKPQVQPQQQQQPAQTTIKKIVKQHLPQTNLVTTATTVLMKPTVYTVTQPMQAVHIVSNHHPKTISSASVAQQQSASSFSMADILNKDATTSASSRPSSTAPPGVATAPSTASSGGSNHVTPTKPPNIDVTPSANSTKAQYPQQVSLNKLIPLVLCLKVTPAPIAPTPSSEPDKASSSDQSPTKYTTGGTECILSATTKECRTHTRVTTKNTWHRRQDTLIHRRRTNCRCDAARSGSSANARTA